MDIVIYQGINHVLTCYQNKVVAHFILSLGANVLIGLGNLP